MASLPTAALDNPLDVVILLVLAFLLFGKQLPEVARNLGKSIRELKESVNFDEVTDAISTVNEVRSTVSPTTIARATLPGVAELQDTVGAAKDLVNPFAATAAAQTGAESAPAAAAATQSPQPAPEAEPAAAADLAADPAGSASEATPSEA